MEAKVAPHPDTGYSRGAGPGSASFIAVAGVPLALPFGIVRGYCGAGSCSARCSIQPSYCASFSSRWPCISCSAVSFCLMTAT